MQTTMDLLNRAMAKGDMNASQWCESLKMSRVCACSGKNKGET